MIRKRFIISLQPIVLSTPTTHVGVLMQQFRPQLGLVNNSILVNQHLGSIVKINQNVTTLFALCLQLHATCNHLQLSLGVFTTIRSNFNYFGHSYNYDATIGNFILLIKWLLGLYSSMNILICLTGCNSHQISHILKVFYNDIGVYFYVCIKIIFTIYYIYHKYIFVCILIMCMYVYCSYNETKN